MGAKGCQGFGGSQACRQGEKRKERKFGGSSENVVRGEKAAPTRASILGKETRRRQEGIPGRQNAVTERAERTERFAKGVQQDFRRNGTKERSSTSGNKQDVEPLDNQRQKKKKRGRGRGRGRGRRIFDFRK